MFNFQENESIKDHGAGNPAFLLNCPCQSQFLFFKFFFDKVNS